MIKMVPESALVYHKMRLQLYRLMSVYTSGDMSGFDP
jgi:hypothetical protein